MEKMNEIKERMVKLELNQFQGSEHLKEVHSRLNQIEMELHKSKNELSETVKKEVNEAVSWEMEGVKRNITVLFESGLRKLEHHLENTITTLVCNMSKEDQPSSNSRHHKTIRPKRGSPQEEFNHDLSPNHEQSPSPPKMNGYQMKPKLELSKFNGDTKWSVVWINKAEEFFPYTISQLTRK